MINIEPLLSKVRKRHPMPIFVVSLVLLSCILPTLLMTMGYDFSSNSLLNIFYDSFQHLEGAFVHTILEWLGVAFAVISLLLSLSYFSVNKDTLIPIICSMFFFSASMDAFHILAADRLIFSVADSVNFIPFTWAISRIFHSMILAFAVTVATTGLGKKLRDSGFVGIFLTFFVFSFIVLLTIYISANASSLPVTTFPENVVSRPWDIFPIFVYMYCLWISWLYYQSASNAFTYAIFLCAFPNIGTQFHMAFGSSAIFDAHFNIGHFLKVISYFVPLLGFIFLFKNIQLSEQSASLKLKKVLNSVPSGIVVVDEKGCLIFVNSTFGKIFGYSVEEVIGKSLEMFLPDNLRTTHVKQRNEYMKEPTHRSMASDKQLVGIAKDKSLIPLEIALTPLDSGGTRQIMATITDITQRIDLEKNQQNINQQLFERNRDLEDFQKLVVDRELEMIRLKKEVNDFAIKDGEKAQYVIPELSKKDSNA